MTDATELRPDGIDDVLVKFVLLRWLEFFGVGGNGELAWRFSGFGEPNWPTELVQLDEEAAQIMGQILARTLNTSFNYINKNKKPCLEWTVRRLSTTAGTAGVSAAASARTLITLCRLFMADELADDDILLVGSGALNLKKNVTFIYFIF